jgi:hypothetical protein
MGGNQSLPKITAQDKAILEYVPISSFSSCPFTAPVSSYNAIN